MKRISDGTYALDNGTLILRHRVTRACRCSTYGRRYKTCGHGTITEVVWYVGGSYAPAYRTLKEAAAAVQRDDKEIQP